MVLLKEKAYSLRAPTPPPAIEPSTTPSKRKRPNAGSDRSRTRSASIVERTESPPLIDVDEDVKPDISEAGPSRTTSDLAGEDEGEEVRVKDYKPSVEVSFKGKLVLT